jgi:hypothetical protein
VFEWPDDMTEAERRTVVEIEASVRAIVAPLDRSVRLEEVASMLIERTFVGVPFALAGRMRIVVDGHSSSPATFPSQGARAGRVDGLRVRFTWTKYELDRRRAEAERARLELRRREREEREAAERRRPATYGHSAITATAAELAASRSSLSDALNADMTAALEEAERRGDRRAWETPPWANEAAANAPVRNEDREYRREVLGQWRDPVPPAYPSRDLGLPLVRPILDSAAAIAAFLTVTADEVRRGTVIRSRDGVPYGVPGHDSAELRLLLETRRPGDQWYFVPATPDPWTRPIARIDLRRDPEIPGTVGYAIAARQARAAELVIAGLRSALFAWVMSRYWTERFLEVLLVIAHAWAANPALVELDIDAAPFGVDLEPTEDAAAARFALLEVDK